MANKTLSDSHDEILRLQGMGWMKRKAIKVATITLRVNHYKDDNGVDHIDIDQTMTGGIPGNSERRTLDWTERENNDPLFGHVVGKSRRVKNLAEDIENEFMKKNWTEDTVRLGPVHAWVKSDTPKSGTTWVGEQIWGIEEINGERRYARHVHFIGPKGEVIDARLVYDYNKASLNLRTSGSSEDPESVTQYPRTPWNIVIRVKTQVASRYPGFYEKASRFLRYWRGPRPKVDLPPGIAPKPLLDVDLHVRGHHILLPIESRFLRHTRHLTNPWLFVILVVGYIIGFAFFARAQWFLTPPESFIGCTDVFWGANIACGLDGQQCTFDIPSFDFRCPAQCSRTILQNPRTVGDQQANLVPLIVGGGDSEGTYRGDTFICAAAVQAGLISDERGGCTTVNLLGNFTDFLPFSAHGLSSIGFPTVFPLSWRFSESTSLTSCADNRDFGLAFNVLVTCIVFFLLRPKAIVKFWCLVCIGFWHITLFSQPTGPPPALDDAFETFLPLLFISYGLWRVGFRYTLPAFKNAPIESSIWYLGPFWVGVLSNLTLDKIPIDRLVASDLTKRSGAITALVIIVVVVTVLVINQVRVFRKTGWLPHYLAWYIAGGLVAMVLALLPGLTFRLHHWIIGIVLMPVTALPTRPSAVYQGFLLGLFLNGAAAFGLDSILQTPAELRQDAVLGSDLPTFLTNSTNYNSSVPFANQTILWDSLPSDWDGFLLLVDDVERYAGAALNFSLASLNASLPHFFRLALTSSVGTVGTGDFTNAAVLFPNGSWVDPVPGASF
ncbi:hypothetical protein D9758_000419 [Tetrapyrgos nigripes]|uniref:LCCL domain-containing protein n=1 Tax=Tetrapyrgos nigripes TaxID=182062 RepID=A0A8H5H2C4_9AGAR|nr:hypothetical protein D9758_000419 [Tetrapyrgos nigripes]